ncbi:zinc finger FYVE domain-containing protein 9 [Anopheles nili]|uniref:zinc finger FYVE domain-containing protein 9 n=1 Tax=Anopheles nili TaxID=185578 RepID=UPI00237C3C7C|nr:zinc finger FYVE domain-containing protein 9 [Anopheles nili]
MDLVDIDKVLDDLELNEDDGNSTLPKAVDISPSTRDPAPAVNGSTEPTVASASTTQSQEKLKFKANVVNVSTVFTSLNEYVNAGGTELGGGKHVASDTHELSIPSERKPLLTPPSTSSVSSDVKTSSAGATTSSVPTSPHTELSPESSPEWSDSSESYCPSREATSSLSSFAHSSSRSSSSSSASTSDAEDMGKCDGEAEHGHAHEKLPEELSSLSAKDYVLDTSSMTTLATTNEGGHRKEAPAGDPQDTSAFSYRNSLYSDTLSNDVINLEGISSISSIVAVDLTKSGQVPFARDTIGNVEGAPVAKDEIETTGREDVERPGKAALEAANVQKPAVGFESTMDDVSDTELESYLQELEEFDFRSVNVENATVPPKPDEEQPSEAEPEEQSIQETEAMIAGEPEDIPTVQKDRTDANSIDSRSDDEISPSSSRGENEDDLISQASTLEFNDLAMAATTAAVAVVEPSEPVVPLATGTIRSEEEVPVPLDTLEVSGEFPLDEDGSEIRFIDCTETESERHLEAAPTEDTMERRRTVSHPERPTSLELVRGTDPEAAGMQSSPGHTPPSSRGIASDQGLTLSSTSSDDFGASIEARTTVPHGTEAGLLDGVEASRLTDTIQSPIASSLPTTSLLSPAQAQLGKVQPFWVPDNSTKFCMQCNQKFSVIKRRHHCRACGQLLCSSCCCLKAKLEYLGDVEARVCIECDVILSIQLQQAMEADQHQFAALPMAATAEGTIGHGAIEGRSAMMSGQRQPNPNNPMEYCSVIPPLQQAASSTQAQSPISVMVPVGVLKRAGAPRNMRKDKNVIFSDGIRPGCDLTELDQNWDAVPTRSSPPRTRKTRVQTPPGAEDDASAVPRSGGQLYSLIPPEENKLPPVLKRISPTESKLVEIENDHTLLEGLREVTLTFAIQKNFHVLVTIVELACCINRTVINFTTRGLHYIGQDEIIILLVLGDSRTLPKDIFVHLHEVYCEADRGHIITELGFSPARSSSFLGSKNHGGFLYVRPTYQCMKAVITPEAPYLIGVLIHRWEVPWAKILPLRLMLRLGALYRYYPCPHVSERDRESVYVEIAQTIVNLLADFRHFSYTIPNVRGMAIHMEDRKTSILIPRNRYEQVVKVVDGSSEQLMAVGGNFSRLADGHLVCVQNTESGCPEATQYSTQAINIESQPCKVTGACFLVLDGSLKPNSGFTGTCTILEDGLRVLIPPAKLQLVKEALKAMKDYQIVCGPVEGDDSQRELVSFEWTTNDLNFNIGVTSPIDGKALDGVPSIRVHRGTDYSNTNHIMRWTEVFILKGDEESNHPGDPINMSKLSETIAKIACKALLEYLDLLASNGLTKIALRISSNRGEMEYVAGSGGNKLAPLYSNALGHVVMEFLQRQATALHLDQHDLVFELVFHILDK